MALFGRTVQHLQPSQVGYRAKLRAQRLIDPVRLPRRERRRAVPVDVPGWPKLFAPLDRAHAASHPSAQEALQGQFRFLNADARVPFEGPRAWAADGASQLWRFHLHYWEWAWAFVHEGPAERRALAALLQSWQDASPIGTGDAWSPYVASLRVWVLCGLVHEGVLPHDETVLAAIDRHHRFVNAHLERDVGGNHLIKNLKALAGSSIFLGDRPGLRRACLELGNQLSVQVLPDGGHYELSPSYHCQVLGDLVDVQQLMACAGLPPIGGIDDAIGRMRRWLGAMVTPDGDVPLFNDAERVGPARVIALEPESAPKDGLTLLRDSGYVVLRPDDRTFAVVDIGHPCPDALPAHAHADCLSFELWVDGRQVVVDTAVSEYGSGTRRQYERSTAAHNTAVIGGVDQTEVWGAFRAARRARPTVHAVREDGETALVVASHDGYRRLDPPAGHTRTFVSRPGELEIIDELSGRGHCAEVRFHIPQPRDGETVEPGGVVSLGNGVELECDQPVEISETAIARSFGRLEEAAVVVGTVTLPAVVRTTLRW